MTRRGWQCSRSKHRTWVLTALCRLRCMLPLRFPCRQTLKPAFVLVSRNRAPITWLLCVDVLCSNVPFARLKDLMGSSAVGIHTMWNGASITRHLRTATFERVPEWRFVVGCGIFSEHFGIGVVEMMAAGLGVVSSTSVPIPKGSTLAG
jgi:hypothetical protein